MIQDFNKEYGKTQNDILKAINIYDTHKNHLQCGDINHPTYKSAYFLLSHIMIKHEGKVHEEADFTLDQLKLLVKHSKDISRITRVQKRKMKKIKTWKKDTKKRKKSVLLNNKNQLVSFQLDDYGEHNDQEDYGFIYKQSSKIKSKFKGSGITVIDQRNEIIEDELDLYLYPVYYIKDGKFYNFRSNNLIRRPDRTKNDTFLLMYKDKLKITIGNMNKIKLANNNKLNGKVMFASKKDRGYMIITIAKKFGKNHQFSLFNHIKHYKIKVDHFNCTYPIAIYQIGLKQSFEIFRQQKEEQLVFDKLLNNNKLITNAGISNFASKTQNQISLLQKRMCNTKKGNFTSEDYLKITQNKGFLNLQGIHKLKKQEMNEKNQLYKKHEEIDIEIIKIQDGQNDKEGEETKSIILFGPFKLDLTKQIMHIFLADDVSVRAQIARRLQDYSTVEITAPDEFPKVEKITNHTQIIFWRHLSEIFDPNYLKHILQMVTRQVCIINPQNNEVKLVCEQQPITFIVCVEKEIKNLDDKLILFDSTYKGAFKEYDFRVHKDCIKNDHTKCLFGSQMGSRDYGKFKIQSEDEKSDDQDSSVEEIQSQIQNENNKYEKIDEENITSSFKN